MVNNNAGTATSGWPPCSGRAVSRKIVCSIPRQADSWRFDEMYRGGQMELELVPQGNLAERIRAAGRGHRRLLSRPPATVHGWPRARNADDRRQPLRAGVSATGGLRADQGRTWPTRPATWSTARPPATSARDGRRRRRRPWSQVDEVVPARRLGPGNHRDAVYLVDRIVARPGGGTVAVPAIPAGHRANRPAAHAGSARPNSRPPRCARDIPSGASSTSASGCRRGSPTTAADSEVVAPHRERHAGHGPGGPRATSRPRPDQRRASSRDRAASAQRTSTTPTASR